jgi:hypothetical protein
MKLSNNAPSIWPGYVAAVASLVLSLLLLLAILVFALTQVGSLVAAYMKEILRADPLLVAQTKLSERTFPERSTKPLTPQPSGPNQEQESIKPGTPLRQIKLVFGANISDIPAAQRAEVIASIKQIQGSIDGPWLIWSTTLSGDDLMERTVYRLMLSARKILVEQNIAERQIELRLQKSSTPPPGYAQGEIAVYIAPKDAINSGRGR